MHIDAFKYERMGLVLLAVEEIFLEEKMFYSFHLHPLFDEEGPFKVSPQMPTQNIISPPL